MLISAVLENTGAPVVPMVIIIRILLKNCVECLTILKRLVAMGLHELGYIVTATSHSSLSAARPASLSAYRRCAGARGSVRGVARGAGVVLRVVPHAVPHAVGRCDV